MAIIGHLRFAQETDKRSMVFKNIVPRASERDLVGILSEPHFCLHGKLDYFVPNVSEALLSGLSAEKDPSVLPDKVEVLHKGQESWFDFKESPGHYGDLLDLVIDGGGRCPSKILAEMDQMVELVFPLPFNLDRWLLCGMKRRVEDVVDANMFAVVQSQVNRSLSECSRFATFLLVDTNLGGRCSEYRDGEERRRRRCNHGWRFC